MELTPRGQVSRVYLFPNIMSDPCAVNTLCHVISCLSHMTKLSVLRVKVKVNGVSDVEIPDLKSVR